MLYLCSYTWQPGVSMNAVAERMMHAHSSLIDPAVTVRGWYDLVGGGAGLMILETDDPAAIARTLTPFMDLISYDVRAVTETNLDDLRHAAQQRTGS